jgi:hypothetical protein
VFVTFSTSSSLASIAILSEAGEVLFESEEESNQQASKVCLELLGSFPLDFNEVKAFLADIGPGSFTGTRVGVVLAKTFSWNYGCLCGGASAFDLIAHDQTVVFPSKKGEWFVRNVGEVAYRTEELPGSEWVGFGPGIEHPILPRAARFGHLLDSVSLVDPMSFVPEYLIEPSISTSKKPLGVSS